MTPITTSRLAAFALATALLAPITARAAVQPEVRTSKGHPHAGHIFVGVTMTVPAGVRIVNVFCKATIGGHFKRTSTGGSVYIGGTYIKPDIRKTYVRGRLTRATCAWPIPAATAGRPLSLAPPGCMMDCWNWGFVVSFLDLTRPTGAGRSQTIYRYGPTWTIRA